MTPEAFAKAENMEDMDIDALRSLAADFQVDVPKQANRATIIGKVDARLGQLREEAAKRAEEKAQAELDALDAPAEMPDDFNPQALSLTAVAVEQVAEQPPAETNGPPKAMSAEERMMMAQAAAAGHIASGPTSEQASAIPGAEVEDWIVIDLAAKRSRSQRTHTLTAEGYRPLGVIFTEDKPQFIKRPYAERLIGSPDFMVFDENNVHQEMRHEETGGGDIVSLGPDELIASLEELEEGALRARASQLFPNNRQIGIMLKPQLVHLIRNSAAHRGTRLVGDGDVDAGNFKNLTAPQVVGDVKSPVRLTPPQVVSGGDGQPILSSANAAQAGSREGNGTLQVEPATMLDLSGG